MHDIRKALFLIFLFLTSVCCVGQSLNSYEHSVVFSHLPMNEELSSNTIRAIIEDRKGFVWFGTARGLNRYDGHVVRKIRRSMSLSVTALLEKGDTLWIGSENGLYYYLQRSDTLMKYQNDNKNSAESVLNISAMTLDDNGGVWISTMGSGIMRLSADMKVLSRVPTPNDAGNYGCVMKDSDGNVWASSCWEGHNLILYNKRSKSFEPFLIDYGSGEVEAPGSLAIMQSKDKNLWIGTWNGDLLCVNTRTHKVVKHIAASQTKALHIHSILELSPGHILMGSDSGLAAFDSNGNDIRLYSRNPLDANSLSDNFVYPIMKDREGGLWIGTYYGGVNYTHSQSSNFAFHHHSAVENSVSGNVVNHFCEDRYGRMWIASDDGGLCYYSRDEGRFTAVSLNSGMGEVQNVHALCADDENLYVGTYSKGIAIVSLKTKAVTNLPVLTSEDGERLDASSNAMMVDRDGRLWVGTYSSVSIFNPEKKMFAVKSRFDSPVNAIIQDKKGNVWVATEAHGVWRYDLKKDRWKCYSDFGGNESRVSSSVSANSLYEDRNGRIWAATSYGLYGYDSPSDAFVASGYSSDDISVYSVTGNDRYLWMASSEGIVCYNYVDDKLVQIYNGGSRIRSTGFLPDAVCTSSGGRIYMGTVNGFLSFSPRMMFHNEVKPKVVFTGVEIFNKPVPVGSDILPESLAYLDEIVLSYRDDMIRISFSAMSFLQPEESTYSYRLEGLDEDWIESGNVHYATYTNLSPGEYVLHVRAKNNDGVQSDEAVLRVVITPPFYWNTPAKIIYVLLIAAAIALLVMRIVRKQQKRHKAEIHEINVQKEQEIHKINIQKEQEIQEIHIQKEQEIQEINIQKEQEINVINAQKEQEIQEMNTRMEQEVHDARIKFMTISSKDQAFLDKLEAVIEQNFSNSELSVDFLASELGVSRSGLFGKIKTLADVTPNEMILVIRLKHAAEMLQSKQYRVNEVCYMVGFSSPSYFSKCFQKMYGVTPAKYEG